MAKKADIKALKIEIQRLNIELGSANERNELLSITNHTQESDIERLKSLNSMLAEERDRISRSDYIHQQKCMSLLSAIAILGRNEMARLSDEIWHTCKTNSMQEANEQTIPNSKI